MTFNTTSLPLQRAIRDKWLLVREPIRPLNPLAPRYLLVSPEVDALLDGVTEFGMFPDWECDVLVARWIAGYLMTISRKMTKKKPDIEQIVGYDEVWALCPRKPRPGWRILGRFYDKDVLILLRAWEKRALFNRYAAAYRDVGEHWEALFGGWLPHTGSNISDYVGGSYRDVDATE